MEGTVLPTPAVAGVLKTDFVEARLHCDLGTHAEANKAIQDRLTGSIALPIYAIVDPATEQVLAVKEGFSLKDDFVAFLRSAKSN
jgi:hypothetical protein